MTGYLHQDYAQSLSEFGSPIKLPRCQGWILKRQIPGFPCYDVMGCYPLFTCRDWLQLHADIEDFNDEIICLSLVTDPFGDYDETYLRRCFQDVVIPFKKHYIIDLDRSMETFVSDHHRRYARKALQNVHVEKCENPAEFINDWMGLYANLIEKHNIKGIAVFSRDSFEKQLRVPGIVMFRAAVEDITIGMLLWYVQGEVGYYHLGAYSDHGYEFRASFALFWFAVEYFAANNFQWINLGAGAGIDQSGTDGLSRFKRGWSSGTRTAYFCGHVFDHTRYSKITKAKNIFDVDYFPAYRKGEFE